ncbi:hypothetical protein A2572_01580 [Candidatus Collierbacteria bacterium RIFOXYD1_FULL_40_9]|uniref:Glycosyltransferase RgtA/B/C/D-like domain-containing protein n=1 Tax=Candidatus Collierbacteria bacterium RIFOXYD1_FULL_40_9 TaxID=1817731 RepID=A0A1F5FUR5_9BACT|nr:MAG: hypothetical protein A2572_01580 [Candidatus Collierbacteria bacterium RIFOXYD1_FULL_40_9]
MKLIVVVASLLLVTFVSWLPFYLKINLPFWQMNFGEGAVTLWKNYDGPNYLIVAKTWYDKASILNNFSNPLPAEYYPAHFPLYPSVIWLFDLVTTGTNAMLLATVLGSVLCFGMFYKYINEFKISLNPLWLSIVFLFLPARFLSLRIIGSPEPWFIFFILASLYFFRKEKFWWAGIWGYFAMLTKSPAVLLLAAYGVYALAESIKNKKIEWKYYPILIMPLAIVDLFYLYKLRTGDFFAYFNSGDNFHLFFPPFSIFAPQGQVWVGNFWLEDIIWTWLIFGLGVLALRKKELKIEQLFAGIFFISTLFVAHRDVSRYIIPVAPFVLMGLDKYLQKKEFKIMLTILALPILLYSWNFLLHNTSPVADWAPYL